MLSRDSSLKTAMNAAESLYQLIELINANIKDMSTEQITPLTALCLSLSVEISIWMDAEFERREE